jgi:hypothetical protein
MADPVAEAVKDDEKVEGEEGKETPEDKVEDKDLSNKDVVNAIKEVKEVLAKSGKEAPTRSEIRAALKEKTGFTDAQLDVVEQLNSAAFQASSKKTAELQEKLSWMEFKEEVGGKIDPAIEKIMKQELAEYAAEDRGDKVLLKKVYFLAKGMVADKVEKTKKADPAGNDKLNNDDKIAGRKIVDDTPGAGKGLEGESKSGNGAKLDDDEKMVARKMGMSEADYALSKTTKIVSQLKGSK